MKTEIDTQTQSSSSLIQRFPCGCHEATRRTTRAFEDADGGPLFISGYTCKCGRCFYKKPEYGNWSNADCGE
mgnify:CR=1 FL=1